MFLSQNVIREDDDFSDNGELGHLSYLDLMHSSELLARAHSSGYFAYQGCRQSTESIFQMYLEDNQWINNEFISSKY